MQLHQYFLPHFFKYGNIGQIIFHIISEMLEIFLMDSGTSKASSGLSRTQSKHIILMFDYISGFDILSLSLRLLLSRKAKAFRQIKASILAK